MSQRRPVLFAAMSALILLMMPRSAFAVCEAEVRAWASEIGYPERAQEFINATNRDFNENIKSPSSLDQAIRSEHYTLPPGGRITAQYALHICIGNALKAVRDQQNMRPSAGQQGAQSTQPQVSKTFALFDKFLGSRCDHVPARTQAWFDCREPYFREYIKGCGQLEDPDGSYPVARLREIVACGDKNHLRGQGITVRQDQGTPQKTASAPGDEKTSLPDNECAKETGKDDWGVKITNVCAENIYFYWCYKQISPMSDQDKQYLCRPHNAGWGPGTSYHTQGLGIAPGATINAGIHNAGFTLSAVACKFSKGLPFLTGVSGNTSKGVCAKP